jgi:hypothetical protein
MTVAAGLGRALAAAALIVVAFTAPAAARLLPGFIAASPTIRLDLGPGFTLQEDEEIIVEGRNAGQATQRIILRVDDARSGDYASRFDLERMAAPGPFRVRLSAGQMRTPSGRFLDRTDLRRVIVSVDGRADLVHIAAISAKRSFSLHEGARGFDFGPEGQAVFPGFEPVAPGDVRVSGRTLVPVRRPSGDPLVADGIRGVERFDLAWPDGRWTVSLFTQDPGEWEFVPHPLNRRIRFNGQTIDEWRISPRQWFRDGYLAGYHAEDVRDPWEAFGRRRSGIVTGDVEVTGGRLAIELAGDSIQSTYVAAVLIEPAGTLAALDAVQAERRTRFLETWPVIGPGMAAAPPAMVAGLLAAGTTVTLDWRPSPIPVEPTALPRGTVAPIDVVFVPAADDRNPTVMVEPPRSGMAALPVEVRWGHWRFGRPDTAMGGVVADADHLRGDLAAMTLKAGLPRRVNVLVSVPPEAAPGLYRGAVAIRTGETVVEQRFAVDVLPAVLPPATRPVGVYLEARAGIDWFAELEAERRTGLACDVAVLRRLGLTGLAPPIATPRQGDARAAIEDIAFFRLAGFDLPMLAYAPVKRALAESGPAGLTAALRETLAGLDLLGMRPPVWSIADEPGNPGSTPEDLVRIREAIRAAGPDMLVAGHLNHPGDRRLLSLFDTVLVNAGFGLDADEIAAIPRRGGPDVWLYNMPDVELAAGVYLWRSGAGGYLQWHARSATADPYDPTDGREGDVMLLPPSPEPCPSVADVDGRLLRMARGLVDQRWLEWAQARVLRDPKAARSLEAIHASIPALWPHRTDLAVDVAGSRRSLAALSKRAAQ